VGDRVIKDGTHVEYTRRNGTVVTGWTTACEPNGVVTDEGLVMVEGPAYRLQLTFESARLVGHPVTVAGYRLRVVRRECTAVEVSDLGALPCGEPVLGPLRVCYDHATLCLKCREEPTNPGTVCEVCASEVTP
jgi:hypothetical protein